MRRQRRTQPSGGTGPERFDPTSGRATGVLGLLSSAALVGFAIALHDGVWLSVLAAGLFLGVVVWAALLRPRVSLSASHLELRNMLETVEIPLLAVESVVVRQLFVVWAHEKRYTNPGVGRSLREVTRGPREATAPRPGGSLRLNYADYVTERILGRVDDALAEHGIRRRSPAQRELEADVRRRPAWPEIGALVACLVAFVLTVLL